MLLARPIVLPVVVPVDVPVDVTAIAPAASSQAPAPNAVSRTARIHPNLSLGFSRAPGMSIIATKQNMAMPNSSPDQRTRIFVAILKDAAIYANPKK